MPEQTTHLRKDSIGGATLQGFGGRTLVLDEPGLFAVDVIDAPLLERIEFRRLDANRQTHLVLCDLPALRHVVLPADGAPAIVHFCASITPERVLIEGKVAEIDAAWPETQIAVRCEGAERTWDGVLLSRTSAVAHPPPLSSGLLILSGAVHAAHRELCLPGGNDCLLTDVGGLARLELDAPRQVLLRRLPDLVSVSSQASALCLQVEDAPMLERVEGVGDTFSLQRERSRSTALCIAPGWQHVRIHDPNLKSISLTGGQSVALFDCGGLEKVELPMTIEIFCHGVLPGVLPQSARFFFDESSLTRCFKRYEQGDDAQLEVITTILAKAHERSQVVLSLQRIARLCELKVPPALVWQTRRELAARHLGERPRQRGQRKGPVGPARASFRTADTRWRWHFPDDLAHQGWEADVQIWRYCQGHFSPATNYGETMARSCEDESALHSLVRLAGDTRTDAALYTLAIKALKHRLGSSRQPMSKDGLAGGLRLARLISHPSACTHTRQTVIAYLLATTPLTSYPAVLPSVLPLAPGLFRAQLMALSQKHDAWFVQRFTTPMVDGGLEAWIRHWRQQLLALALAPLETRPAYPGEAVDPTRFGAQSDTHTLGETL